MTRRTHRHECVVRFAFDYRIDRATRCSGGAQCGLERINRNGCVSIEIARAFVDYAFDMLEVLGCVTGLNVSTASFIGFELENVRPNGRVTA